MTHGEALAKAAEVLTQAESGTTPERTHALVAVAGGWTNLAVMLHDLPNKPDPAGLTADS